MTKIPLQVAESKLTNSLYQAGLKRCRKQGKVSEIYCLPDDPDNLLMLTTDRKSIFNFVLNCLAPRTGEVITAMTILFYTKVLKEFETHLVAWGTGIDRFLPIELRNNKDLQKRAVIVKEYEVALIELIWRFCITGSGLKNYKKTGMVYGHHVRAGLEDGDELEHALFTPTVKSEDDEPISPADVAREYGIEYEQISGMVAQKAHDYCLERNIIMADLKQEFSKKQRIVNKPRIILLDKMGGDEARFWDKDEWKRALKEGVSPPSWDKEILRKWGEKVLVSVDDFGDIVIEGLNNLDPKNEDHVAAVHAITVPAEVIAETVRKYFLLFERLNDGESLEDFQCNVMGIEA